MSNHTPGPWKVSQTLGNKLTVESEQDARLSVAIIQRTPLKETYANARLIAAAPDLLEALNYLLEQTVDSDLVYGIELTEGEQEARQKALAAIAKAKEGCDD